MTRFTKTGVSFGSWTGRKRRQGETGSCVRSVVTASGRKVVYCTSLSPILSTIARFAATNKLSGGSGEEGCEQASMLRLCDLLVAGYRYGAVDLSDYVAMELRAIMLKEPGRSCAVFMALWESRKVNGVDLQDYVWEIAVAAMTGMVTGSPTDSAAGFEGYELLTAGAFVFVAKFDTSSREAESLKFTTLLRWLVQDGVCVTKEEGDALGPVLAESMALGKMRVSYLIDFVRPSSLVRKSVLLEAVEAAATEAARLEASYR